MTNSAPIRPGCNLHQLQRTNVEASDPPALVNLSLSGFFDAWYAGKRRRVNRLTRAEPGAPRRAAHFRIEKTRPRKLSESREASGASARRKPPAPCESSRKECSKRRICFASWNSR